MPIRSRASLLSAMTLAGAVALGPAGEARADGMFAQLDVAPGDVTAVLSAQRGRLSYGTVYSDYGNGADLNFQLSYAFALGDPNAPVTLRVGPAVQYEGLKTWKAGARIVAEHYRPTEFGNIFLLGEYSTIDNAYFALASVGLRDAGLAVELTHQGDDDGFRETALALSVPLEGTDVALRAGYKFRAKEVFVGVSWNTF